jgi:hypothetical protein
MITHIHYQNLPIYPHPLFKHTIDITSRLKYGSMRVMFSVLSMSK